MKQKHKQDQQSVADLLKQLQASFLGEKKTEKKNKSGDADDRAFQEKLKSMLGKVSDTPQQKQTEDLASPEPSVPEEPLQAVMEAPSPKETALQEVENVEEAAPTAPKKVKKAKSKKKEKVVSQSSKGKTNPDPLPAPSQLDEIAETEETQTCVPTLSDDVPASEDEVPEELPTVPPVEEEEIAQEESVVSQNHAHPLDKVIPLDDTESTESQAVTLDQADAEEEAEHDTTVEVIEEAQPEELPLVSSDEVEPELESPPLPSETAEAQIPPSNHQPKKKSEKKGAKPIVIPAPAKEQKRQAKETAQQKPPLPPQRITISSPKAFVVSSEKEDKDSDAIVIRPPVSKMPEPQVIVVRPRNLPKQEVSLKHPDESVTQAPIKIGAKKSAPSQEAPTKTDSEKIDMKNENKPTQKNVTLAASTEKQFDGQTMSQTKKPTPSSVPKKAGVTLPRNTLKKTDKLDALEKNVQRRDKKNPTRSNFIKNNPDDERLEEVLDEPLPPEDELIEEIAIEEPEEIVLPPKKLSIFQRRQQKKQELAEQKLSAMEIISKRSGLTEDDIVMMFELGYENELGHLVGYENLKRLKGDFLRRASKNDHHHYRTAFGYRGTELTSNRHANAVLSAYLHDRKHLLLRFLLTTLLTVALFFVDMPQFLVLQFTETIPYLPKLLPFLSVVLFVLTALLSKRQLLAGARSLLRFSPTPYSVCAVLAPITILYDIAVLFIKEPMPNVNFLVALAILFTVICDIFRLSCEMRALKIIFSDEDKHVLVPATPRKKKLRRGEKIVKIINDDLGKNIYSVRKAEQTVGFFRRFNHMESAARPFTVILGVTIALSFASGLVAAVLSSSLPDSLSAFMNALLLSMPISALCSFFYPLYRANRLLSRKNCALLGEESVEEYGEEKTVIFEDSDLYELQACTKIAVRQGDDVRNDLKLAAILFRKLGGTLKNVDPATKLGKEDPPVSIVRVHDSGIEAIIDNRNHLLVGSAEFLRRGGVRVPKESTEKMLELDENAGLTYVAVDGILKLSYEMVYTSKKDFEKLIRDLADSDTAVAINSYDPNLNEAFLQRSRPDDPSFVQVIKQGRFEAEQSIHVADTGAVALDRATDLVYPLHAAKHISLFRQFGFRIQLISSILGTAGTVLLTVLGQGSLIGVPIIALYQLFWTAVSLIAAGSEINAEKLHLD